MSQHSGSVSLPGTAADATGFYGSLTSSERRTFWGCAAGWTLDGMDFMIYPLVIGTIMGMWHVSAAQAGLAATVTLLFSALGGWLAGYLSDRVGRVLTLQLTIAWFSLFSLLCAFVQSFDQLLVARALLGLGFGGEWAAGAILMGEMVRPQFRGRTVGTVQSGWAVGWGLAVLLQAVLFSLMPAEQAWRYMFAVGAAPALLILFVRRHVQDPEIAVQARRAQVERPALPEIFTGPHLRTTILASLMMCGAQGSYYAMSTWVPRYLTAERHLTNVGSTAYLATLILGSFVGYLTGAWLADRIGRRLLFLCFSIGAIVTLLVYLQLPLPAGAVWLLGLPLGFFSTGYFSGIGPFLTEIYPTRIRGSGQGFCYNFGRGLGALFPAMVGYLAAFTTLANAITLFAGAALVLFFAVAFTFPETRGKVLDA